jgi:hypothetical protein
MSYNFVIAYSLHSMLSSQSMLHILMQRSQGVARARRRRLKRAFTAWLQTHYSRRNRQHYLKLGALRRWRARAQDNYRLKEATQNALLCVIKNAILVFLLLVHNDVQLCIFCFYPRFAFFLQCSVHNFYSGRRALRRWLSFASSMQRVHTQALKVMAQKQTRRRFNAWATVVQHRLRKQHLLSAAGSFWRERVVLDALRWWHVHSMRRRKLNACAARVVHMSAMVRAKKHLSRWRRLLAVRQRGYWLLQARQARGRAACWRQWRVVHFNELRIHDLKVCAIQYNGTSS